MYVVLCLIVFGCQYQCNWLPGKTRLRMTYYVSSGTLNHTLTHSLLSEWWAWCVLRDSGARQKQASARLIWLKIPIHATLFRGTILTHKVGQTDLVLVYYECSWVGLWTQDYKCLCAWVMICATTNKQPQIYHFDQLIWKAQPAELITRVTYLFAHNPLMIVQAFNDTGCRLES